MNKIWCTLFRKYIGILLRTISTPTFGVFFELGASFSEVHVRLVLATRTLAKSLAPGAEHREEITIYYSILQTRRL